MMKQGWEYKKLGEVCKINSGKSIKAKLIVPTSAPNTFPCFGGNGIRGYVSSYSHDGVYPIVGRVGALCGNVHLAEGRFYATEHALVLTITTQSISANWLTLWLESNKLGQYAKGVAQPVLSASELSKLPLSIPPLSEQQSIVAELDKINEIIDLKKAQLKDLDLLAQSIFYDMFGDPIENPKGWEVKKLGDISTQKLSYGSGASATSYDRTVRYIRITDIDDNGELKDEPVSPNIYDAKYELADGDILFARSGATVGKTFLYHKELGKCIYAGYLIKMVPDKEVVVPLYVYHFTKTKYYKDFISLSQNAVAQPNINAKQYGGLLICIPPLSLQQSFAEKIQAIESQKSAIKQSLAEVETLLASRMDYWFN